MFQTKVVEKIKTHFIFNDFLFFRKSCHLWDNVEKHCTAGQAASDNITRSTRFACRTPRQQHRHSLLILNAYCISTAKRRRGYANAPQRYVHTYTACLVSITGKVTVVSALIHAKLTHCMTIALNSIQNYESIVQQVILSKASEWTSVSKPGFCRTPLGFQPENVGLK
jgi:hypothetical protein